MANSNPSLGLALSGGGFRATLFHLGVVRFLRDARLLEKVTHICSVSGGSILAAHLVLHWERYTGSDHDFDQAAAELVDFVQKDIRGRVVRRWLFAWLALLPLWPGRPGGSAPLYWKATTPNCTSRSGWGPFGREAERRGHRNSIY